MPQPFNIGPIEGQQWVAYPDLSGGRNTKKDPHALDRNQLAQSDNTWMQTGNALSKRPGSLGVQISAGSFGVSLIGPVVGGISIPTGISLGQTGAGISLSGLAEGRFISITTLLAQSVQNQVYAAQINAGGPSLTTWISIGAISGGVIQTAQLYDPDVTTGSTSPDGTLFLVNGVDTPKLWYGPGNLLKPATVAQLPTKNGGSGPITPRYVATLFSSLFYAGEPSDPSMLYISNPFLPQQFTLNSLVPTGTITTSTYIGQPIGRGDGVDGGAITGLARMGSAMIVYKESAIYALTQVSVVGDLVWGSSVASSSVGALSPRSIVAFDTFHCFLGIDGVYTFDGTSTRRISENNPDLFDGPTAQILDRTTAIGVRFGSKYLIFFDNGGGTGIKSGYCNAGAWFDFGKLDSDGYPAVGTISGMNVAGVAALRGGRDFGDFAWADATRDMVSEFNASAPGGGAPVSSDNGAPITASVLAKADFFRDVFGDEAPEDIKNIDSMHLWMSFPQTVGGQTYSFNGRTYYDQSVLFTPSSGGASQTFVNNGMSGIIGSGIIGQMIIGGAASTPVFQHIPLYQQASGNGYIIQCGWTESSIYPWTCLGFSVLVNRQQRVGTATG